MKAPVQYGQRLAAFATYLLAAQYLPERRAARIIGLWRLAVRGQSSSKALITAAINSPMAHRVFWTSRWAWRASRFSMSALKLCKAEWYSALCLLILASNTANLAAVS